MNGRLKRITGIALAAWMLVCAGLLWVWRDRPTEGDNAGIERAANPTIVAQNSISAPTNVDSGAWEQLVVETPPFWRSQQPIRSVRISPLDPGETIPQSLQSLVENPEPVHIYEPTLHYSGIAPDLREIGTDFWNKGVGFGLIDTRYEPPEMVFD